MCELGVIVVIPCRLARLIHVHMKTLRAAARDGRLRVTYDTRTTFRSLRTRATVADADTFLHTYFEQAPFSAVLTTEQSSFSNDPNGTDVQWRAREGAQRLSRRPFAMAG